MHSSFVQWTKQRLFQTVLGHVHQRLLEYFIDLPGSLSFGGFLDSVELKDVCLDLFKINAEFYALGYPLRLCYGHIGKMKLSLSLTQARSHIVFEDVLIVIGPLPEAHLPGVHTEAPLHIIRRHIEDAVLRLMHHEGSATSNLCSSNEKHSAHLDVLASLSWKEIATWLCRYNPNLTISINNAHLRYEHDSTPVWSLGCVLDSLVVRPAEHVWRVEWPRRDRSTSAVAVRLDRLHTSSYRSCDEGRGEKSAVSKKSSSQSCSAHHDTAADYSAETRNARSIFSGSLEGLGVYCNVNVHRWIPLDVLETSSSTCCETLYKRVPATHVHLRAKKEAATHQWVIRPFLLQFQFALQSVDSSSDMVAKAPEADVLGTHFIWSTKDVVCATVTPTLITTFLTLHKYWTSRSALHELMNTFRCLKRLQASAQNETASPIKVSDTSKRWALCRRYIHALRGHQRLQYRLNVYMDAYLTPKRWFIGWIRTALLQYHCLHPKGYLHLTSQFPIIDRPFRLLTAAFVLGKPYYQAVCFDGDGTARVEVIPLSYDVKSKSSSAAHKNSLECCTITNFHDLGLPYPPIGYFFLTPLETLKRRAVQDRRLGDFLALMSSQQPLTIAQWYLLAVRETEEILRVVCTSFQRPLLVTAGNNTSSIHHPCNTKKRDVPPIDVDSVKQWSYMLERDASFYAVLRQLAHQVSSVDKEASPCSLVRQRLRSAPFWSLGALKLEIAADFYEVYMVYFPKTALACRHLNLRLLFDFKDRLLRRREKGKTRVLPSFVLDTVKATPARHRSTDDVASTFSHQEKNVSEKDMSWRELLDSVCSYPTRAYAHLSHRWELASFLWDTTLSVVLKTVELRFCASPSALRYASRRCFGLRIDDVAVQCACQKRIELNAVLQNLLLMNYGYDAQGYPVPRGEQNEGYGFCFLKCTSAENFKKQLLPRRLSTISQKSAMRERPYASSLATSVPFEIVGDVHDASLSHDSDDGDNDVKAGTTTTTNDAMLPPACPHSGSTFSPTTTSRYCETKDDSSPAEQESVSLALEKTGQMLMSARRRLWTELRCTCITQATLEQRYVIESPLFLDIFCSVADIHCGIYPYLLDHLLGLWRDYVWAYRNWVSASAVQRLEWTETTSKLSSSAPQGAEELGNLYRASFYCAILERFPLVLMSTASRSFWNERLNNLLKRLQHQRDDRKSDTSDRLKRENWVEMGDHHQPVEMTGTDQSASKTFHVASGVSALAPLSLQRQRDALEKTRISLRLEYPSAFISLYPVAATVFHTVDAALDIVVPGDVVLIATVRRQQKTQLLISFKRSSFYCTTRQTIHDVLSVIPMLYGMLRHRIAELWNQLSHDDTVVCFQQKFKTQSLSATQKNLAEPNQRSCAALKLSFSLAYLASCSESVRGVWKAAWSTALYGMYSTLFALDNAKRQQKLSRGYTATGVTLLAQCMPTTKSINNGTTDEANAHVTLQWAYRTGQRVASLK